MDRSRSYNDDGEEAEHVGISLFIDPKPLNSGKWQTLLETLTKEGKIRLLVVIGKAHFVSQSDRNLRTEFKLAVTFLGKFLQTMPRPVPQVLLSATILKSDVYECTNLLGDMKLNVLHGDLSCRNIMFQVIISGSAASSLKKSARFDIEKSQ